MQSVRLNKGQRDEIADALLSKRFDAERKKLDEEEYKIADAVYRHVFSENERRRMVRLPEGWLATTGALRVHIAGEYVVVRFKGKARRIPHEKSGYGCVATIGAREKVAQWYTDWQRRLNDHRTAKGKLRNEITAVLGSTTTTKALAEKWPEIEPVIKQVCKPSAVNLPAVRMDKLNTELGLARQHSNAA